MISKLKNKFRYFCSRFLGALTADVLKKIRHEDRTNLLFDEVEKQVYQECATFILDNLREAIAVRGDKWAIREFALNKISKGKVILEFGVWTGASYLWFDKHFSGKVFGFDSFDGLPEEWAGTSMPTEKFVMGGKIPDRLTKYSERGLIKAGWFNETLPKFLKEHPDEEISLIHMDADLYSSTKYVLETLISSNKLSPGTIILFDNYFGYPGWKLHEHKVVEELLKGRFEYIGYGGGARCVIRITR